MFKNLDLGNIIKSKEAVGVEVILLTEGAYEINVLSLKRVKSEVVIGSKTSGIKDIASLAQKLDPNAPIALVINGKGIIHKKVMASENDPLPVLLSKVLPNANADELCIQKVEAGPDSYFVSVVRKTVIDNILDELILNKITNLVSCSVGPFMVGQVLGLMEKNVIENEFLNLTGFKLLIREDKIQEIQNADAEVVNVVKVGEDLLESKSLIPFSAALSCFTGTEIGFLNYEKAVFFKEEFKQKQKFKVFSWSLLIAVFVVLLINYVIFDHYWDKRSELNEELALNQSALKRYQSLKSEYEQKKEFLELNGLLESSRTSYYADRIAASVPGSIQLQEMNIHPLKKKEVTDISGALYFENAIIRISGKCDRSSELNDWMKAIEANEWVSKVKMLDYKQANAKEDGVFFIEVLIK